MGLHLRVLGCLALLAVPPTLIGLSHSGSLARLGHDFWQLPEAMGTLTANQRKGEEIDDTAHHLQVWERLKANLIQEVRAGRLGIQEAAQRLLALLTVPELSPLRGGFSCVPLPGQNDEERMCHLVRFWANESTAVTNPGESEPPQPLQSETPDLLQ